MSLSNDYAPDAFSGDDATVAFATTFPYFADSDLVVTLLDASDVETTLTLGAEYTATSPGAVAAVGTVTLITAPASGETLKIERNLPRTQLTTFPEQDPLPSANVEAGLDRVVMETQESRVQVDRALRNPPTDPESLSTLLPTVELRKSQFAGYDADGAPIALAGVTPDEVTVSSFMETVLDDADGLEAAATLEVCRLNSLEDQRWLALAGGLDIEFDNGVAATNLYRRHRHRISQARPEVWIHRKIRPSDDDAVELLWSDTVGGETHHSGREIPGTVLVNGCARVWRRGTPIISTGQFQNDDDSYVADHVLLLSDGDDIVDVSQETTIVPTGGYASFKLDVETINKKAGLLFPIEARDAARLIGGTASLSFKARTTDLEIGNLMVAVLAWDSTADSITSDVVSVWGATNVEPTFATNWTREGDAPARLALTNVFQTFKVEDISIDTDNAVNLAVFIWIDDTDAALEDVVYIADVQLEPGIVATPFVARPFADELLLCERYLNTSFPLGTAPAQDVSEAGAIEVRNQATGANKDVGANIRFPVPMFAAPSLVTYSPGASTSAWHNISDDSASGAAEDTAKANTGFFLNNPTAAADEAYDLLAIHYTAVAEM